MGQTKSKTSDDEFDRMNSNRSTRTETHFRKGKYLVEMTGYNGTVKFREAMDPSAQSRKSNKEKFHKIETQGNDDNYTPLPFKSQHTDMMRPAGSGMFEKNREMKTEGMAAADGGITQKLIYSKKDANSNTSVKKTKGRTASQVIQFQNEMASFPGLGAPPISTQIDEIKKLRFIIENKAGSRMFEKIREMETEGIVAADGEVTKKLIYTKKDANSNESVKINKGRTALQVNQFPKEMTSLPGLGAPPISTETNEIKKRFNMENKGRTALQVNQFQKEMTSLPGLGAPPISTETNEIKKRINMENKGNQELVEWLKVKPENESSLISAWAHRTVQSFNISLTTNTLMRQQQDAAYLKSLRADQEKENRKREERERQEQEQLRLRQEREAKEQQILERELRKCELLKMLPSEPNQDHPDSIRILLMTPRGQRIERRFLRNQSIKWLYYYVFCHKECPDDFKINTNFPRKTLACEPIDGQSDPPSFAEAGLGQSQMLFVQDNQAYKKQTKI